MKDAAAAETSREPMYLAITAGLAPQVFPLTGEAVVLGRSAEAGIQLNHVEVSRRHCVLTFSEGRWRIEDLGSRWGTRINGRRITSPVELSPGDSIATGPVQLVLAAGSISDSTLAGLQLGPRAELGPLLPVLFRGTEVTSVVLGEQVTFGRDEEADVLLADPAVSRRQAMVRKTAVGYRIIDLHSTAGSFVNGHRFDEHDLTIGDRVQMGPFFFQFDGSHLEQVTEVSGGAIAAEKVTLRMGKRVILDRVTLHIASCRFTGIIGPSGAGKSSLLGALSGQREPDEGLVLSDGVNLYADREARSFGYVPQEDIVHPELTVEEALTFSAELRLPRGTPVLERHKLITRTMAQLGVDDRASTPIWRLSGGQRKRVSVGVELLARPSILFLDEPSSGLDPATEFKLMELLRDLADSGCTIICTTHVMENVYLMDQLAVLYEGRLVFNGSPQEARNHFGVSRLTALYEQLEERPATEWQESSGAPPGSGGPPAPSRRRRRDQQPRALPILLRRQWTTLRADWRNFAILAGQPLLIAALVSWVSDDASLLLFFAYIATLWFGCSNAAQEIVKEIAIYRRERVVGLSRNAYLMSKFTFIGLITIVQAMLLYGLLQMTERDLDGSAVWQAGGLCGIAVAAVGLGCAISAVARSVMQAVLIVPLVLIPQILFSGKTVPVNEMTPLVRVVSGFMPSFAAQTAMDSSFFWGRTIDPQTLEGHYGSLSNLRARYSEIRTGVRYISLRPAISAFATQALWAIVFYLLAFISLRKREKS